MGVFDRYAPFVQDFIYRHDWESLRGVQVAAAEALFDTEDNVLLTASTASGKTEAAFFPILTLFDENPPTSVGALYIGPLKALINDQFLRLNDLCEEAQIPVWRWHGDVSASHKAASCKSRRSRLSRYCSIGAPQWRISSATCASLSSTRFTPCFAEIAEGRHSVSLSASAAWRR